MSTIRDVRSAGLAATAAETGAALIFLHGCGSNEHDPSSLAELLGLELPWAALRAPLKLGHGAAAWFQITTPGVPGAAQVEAATDAIWAWIEATLPEESRTIPIGFSQGGLMASQLLRTRPDRVLAPAILGGFVLGAEQPSDAALAVSRPQVFWGCGELDQVIAPVAIERTEEFLPAHSTLTRRIYPNLAHAIDAAELTDVRAFVTAQLDVASTVGA